MRTNPSEMELEYFLPRWEAQPEMLSWAEYSKDHRKKRERQLRVNCQSKVVGAKVGGSGLLRLLYIDDQDLKQNFQKVVQSLSLLLTGKKSFTTSPPVTPLPRPTVQCPKAAFAVRKRGKAHGVESDSLPFHWHWCFLSTDQSHGLYTLGKLSNQSSTSYSKTSHQTSFSPLIVVYSQILLR